MSRSQFSRRRFLQGLAVSAAAVPFIVGLDSLYAKAAVPVVPNKRFLFMYSPYTSLYYNARLRPILNSFGLETQTFGDPRFCHGPLPGLTA